MIEEESLPTTIRNQSVVTFSSGSATGFSYSNVVNTIVNGPSIAIVKSAMSAEAGLSLPVTYVLTVSNSGNRAANVIVYDSLPSGTAFVANSILVNGAPVPGITPGAGIPLGEVNPGSVYAIVFQVILTSVPPSGVLVNQARADYEFVTLDHRVITGSSLSNALSLPVGVLAVSVHKSVSAAVTFVGDMIAYSILVSNESSESIRQSLLLDPLPQGVGFVPGSVTVGGVRNPSASPANGIPIGTIEPGASKQIAFNAVVLDVPVHTRLTNQAEFLFKYGEYDQFATSNPVTVIVSGPALKAVMSVTPVLATIGDILSYTVVVTNAGTLETTIIARDLIPPNTVFVQGSAFLNGRPIPIADPENGITLGSLPPGLSFTLAFQVTVTRAVIPPAQTNIPNLAILAHTFQLPGGMTVTDTLATNTVDVRLVYPIIAAHLEAKPPLAEAGGTFIAEVRITNSGQYAANVTLQDFIPSETELVPGSVVVNGRPVPGSSGTTIAVGSLGPDEAATIVYRLLVDRHPLQHRIRFRVRAAYNYMVNTNEASSSVFSNEASVRIETDDE
ncbi:DUF11 domain-containing protein [Paenibacillus rhizovicinus]|uniref:DUF11 domain-containing protein n=1 Tax=Paenibacillus rhizovicinus TaxID=2704463 RepID=A0A6C0P8A9_9BACL|nr:DUF11 domain-containing protein [Paenibacillus rhizovicinus]QHW34646.1 DUF11 domain-containing protein [Paenibacillus rhizovicinus]